MTITGTLTKLGRLTYLFYLKKYFFDQKSYTLLKVKKSQYKNFIFQLNYTRSEKCNNTKLFTTKRSTNFSFYFWCKSGSNGYKVKIKREYYYKNLFLSSFTKIRPQAKIDNFAFKNSNIIIEGSIWKKKKIIFHEKNLKHKKIILLIKFFSFLIFWKQFRSVYKRLR